MVKKLTVLESDIKVQHKINEIIDWINLKIKRETDIGKKI